MNIKKHSGAWLMAPSLCLTIMLASCDPFGSPGNIDEPRPAEAEGWAPVYASADVSSTIEAKEAQPIENGGKIYIKGSRLYQVEAGKGIHIIDIQDGNNPQKLRFIQVTGAQEIAIMNNNLYTNNVNDLVVLNIADINNIQVINRVTDMFHLVDPNLPPTTGYFECIDPEKGVVVGWEPKTIQNPVCRKN